jgi:hypothetical protein
MAYPRRKQLDLHDVVTQKNIMLHTLCCNPEEYNLTYTNFDPEENVSCTALNSEEYNVKYTTL